MYIFIIVTHISTFSQHQTYEYFINKEGLLLRSPLVIRNYIIPIPPPAGIAGASDLIVATTDSVVNKVDATLVAF